MSSPAISVIVPTFNTPKDDFERCINSLICQTFCDFEVLIIDDGSSQDSANNVDEICKRDQRLIVLHTENNGVSAARNFGIQEATGSAICFVDADDYCALWMLEDLWTAYLSSDEIDTVLSYFKMTSSDNYDFSNRSSMSKLAELDTLEQRALIGTIFGENELGYLSCGPCAVLLKAELIKNLPYMTDIRYMEDTIWNIQRLRQSKCVVVLEETIYAYKMNPYSATHKYSFSTVDERIKALEVLSDITNPSNREWYALRVLANYYICCKCIMLSDDEPSLLSRLNKARGIGNYPIWDSFKNTEISRKWKIREKCKKWLAVSGVLPLLIAIKGEK